MDAKTERRVVQLYQRGKTLHSVAAAAGVSYAAARRALVRLGVPRRSSGNPNGGAGRVWTDASRTKLSASRRGTGRQWYVDGKGYVLVHAPDHPYARSNGYVFKHRLVLEKVLGRYLEPHEIVHHKDENPQNNRVRNLEVLTRSAHSVLHGRKASGSAPSSQ